MSSLSLPDNTPNGRARAAALDHRHRPDVEPTSMVSYLSHGRVLVIGGSPDRSEPVDDILVFD